MAPIEDLDYREWIKLFLQAFIGVYFVCMNTYFIAKGNLTGIALVSFLISYIWTHNVKKVSTSNEAERVVYSLGAAVGGTLGFLTAKFIL